MGTSRKLQGEIEIDRVLKKVQEGVDVFDSIWNKALMDARQQIERAMERFKVCEKETKTKAFSKEGLGQQPKTDPKEKAKAETRNWLNTVVGDLESQIDNFEARLTHLETSITRHKAHIKKLELILRLLDNDELSPEQVNNVKDFLEDYVERNKDDCDDFSDVELYTTLPLEKVEALEYMVSLGPSTLAKADMKEEIQKLLRQRNQFKTWVQSYKIKDGKGQRRPEIAPDHREKFLQRLQQVGQMQQQAQQQQVQQQQGHANMVTMPSNLSAANQKPFTSTSQDEQNLLMLQADMKEKIQKLLSPRNQFKTWVQSYKIKDGKVTAPSAAPQPPSLDPLEQTVSQESNSDMLIRTPPSKTGPVSIPSPATTPLPTNPSPRPLADGPTEASIVSGPAFSRTASDSGSAAAPPVTAKVPAAVKEDDSTNLPGRRPSPAIPAQNRPVQVSVPQVAAQLPVMGLVTSGTVGSVPMKSIVAGDDRAVRGNVTQPLRSPVGNHPMLQQQLNEADGGGSEAVSLGARMFPSAAAASGTQWRPQTPGVTFPTQSEMGQRRPEIEPDHREKFLQRLQQVGQQQQQAQQQQVQQHHGHANMVTRPSNLSAANQKPFTSTSQDEQNLLMLQANMKEEIQKFLRQRNQFKTWVQSYKIKDGKLSPPGPSRRNEPETSVFTDHEK